MVLFVWGEEKTSFGCLCGRRGDGVLFWGKKLEFCRFLSRLLSPKDLLASALGMKLVEFVAEIAPAGRALLAVSDFFRVPGLKSSIRI